MKRRIFKRSLILVLIFVMAFNLTNFAFAETKETQWGNPIIGVYKAKLITTSTASEEVFQHLGYIHHENETELFYLTYSDITSTSNASETLFTSYGSTFSSLNQLLNEKVCQSESYTILGGTYFCFYPEHAAGTYDLYTFFPRKQVSESVLFYKDDTVTAIFYNAISYAPIEDAAYFDLVLE